MANTWTTPAAAVNPNNVRVAKAACTTGSEVPAAATRLTAGLNLRGLQSVTAHIEMAKATGTATLTGVVATDKLTVAGVDFTAVAANPAANQFAVGASDNATAANLAAAIEASVTAAVAGVVTATVVDNIVTVTADSPGTAGNALTLAQTGGHIAVSAGTLAGGTDIGAGASLQGYLLNPATGLLSRAPDFDMPLTAALGAQGLPAIRVDGTSGRLQLLPNAVGAATTVYLNGSPAPLRNGV
jgi:hypothetical protein